ncbi:MAG TPA: hypothetical protein VH234_02155 [Candidatus Saccharimonadales bacterium]|jgi:hypothetical protein|nr:hypothetical protein [Candidatus Saccharimonadales bacterium]
MAIKETLAILSASAAVGAGMAEAPLAQADMAKAGPIATATATTEGSMSANNIICGGVSNVPQLERYLNGAPDKCGHRDIGKILGAYGITPQLAKTMRQGIVCSYNGNWTSSGRQHSPDPAEDKPENVGGASFFERPLGVWGKVCYKALVTRREDGDQVAVLEDCGNGEETATLPQRTPNRQKTSTVTGGKIAKDASGNVINPFPSGIFVEEIRCLDGSKTIDRKVVMSHTTEILAHCNVGTTAKIWEDAPRVAPQNWTFESPRIQQLKVQANAKKNIVTFIDKQVPTPTPNIPAPIVICSGNTTNTNTGIASQGGNCSTNTVTVETPPNTPPPSVPTASFFANNLQEADFNSVNVMRVTIDSATPGDNYEVCDSADFGATLQPSCVDETAPSSSFNVPRQYTALGETMTDHYYATVEDLTTGKFATPPSSETNAANPNQFVEPILVQSGNPVTGQP